MPVPTSILIQIKDLCISLTLYLQEVIAQQQARDATKLEEDLESQAGDNTPLGQNAPSSPHWSDRYNPSRSNQNFGQCCHCNRPAVQFRCGCPQSHCSYHRTKECLKRHNQ